MQRIPIHHKLLGLTFLSAEFLICSWYLGVGIRQTALRWRGSGATEAAQAQGHHLTAPTAFGFPMPSPSRFLDGTFQDDWEESAQRSFLIPEQTLVSRSRALGTWFARRALRVVPASQIMGIPLWKEYLLIESDPQIFKIPEVYRPADMHALGPCADYYNRLKRQHPLVHLYVMPIRSPDDWLVRADAEFSRILAGTRYVEAFRDLLDPAIGYAWIAENRPGEEVRQWYYKTDHHLNEHGAYRAYRQICQLMRAQAPQVGPCLSPPGRKTHPYLQFRGTKSRLAGYYDGLHDPLVETEYDLPAFDIRIHGYDGLPRNHQSAYTEGNTPPAGRFTNHYSHRFGRDYGLITYTCPQNHSGRLLVVGDSHDNCLEELVAAHFHQTFFVDLRHYRADVGRDFDIDDFLVEWDITDVLFLGEQGAVIGYAGKTFICNGS